MKKIVLLSCGKKKRNRRAKAGDMYISPLFTKSLNYAKQKLRPDKVFILSAKHGLLGLGDEIEPYDKKLNDRERRQWASKVLKQLQSHANLDSDHFTFLAGDKYREFLIPHIKHYSVPMKGLKIGKQQAWLNRQIDE